MLKKFSFTITASVLLATPFCMAQASLKCYSTPKLSATWSIGIRTGLSREYNVSYFQSELNSKNRSWTQQIFVQRDMGKHLMLELQGMHQSSWKDVIANTPPITGQTYNSVINKKQRLHGNMILHYIVPTATEQLRTAIGAGFGFIASRTLFQKNYTESGASLQSNTITYQLEGPTLLIALTGSYRIKKKTNISGQASYSNTPVAGLSHLNMNVGIGYQL